MDHNNILGVVLAGGKSKRFGEDKSQVILDGKILINYILSEIVDIFNEILIVANSEIKFLQSKKISKIEDFQKDLGPLGGVLSAMKWIKKNGKNYQWISTFPSDTPFFKKELLQSFFEKIDFNESKLFFIKSNNTRHNIFGLWSVDLLSQLEEDLIKKGDRKVELWANSIGVKNIEMQFENIDPFFNINTKEDLEIAKKYIKKMISYTQAITILNKSKIKISDEIINSTDSLNRVSALDIRSQYNHPAGNNAAFDGFAIRSKDTKNFSQKFKIIGSIAAGNKPFKKKIKKFDVVEIMTGGIIPNGFDSIIPIEQIVFLPNRRNAQHIVVSKKIKKNEHVRFLGSDYKKNDLIIKKGTIIQSKHILALKTLGISKIKVKQKPNILFFSTGNEISNKDNIPNWQVRNSNSHYIKSLEKNFLFNFINGGILKDNHEHLFKKQIKKMLNSRIDMIITSGAVSAGKFDFVPSVINSFKLSNYFKSVAIRPGKPVLFAKIKGKQKVIFGLPGNPISSAACFRFFIQPFLINSLGVPKEKPVKAILKNSFQKKKDFTRFIKSKITTTENGKLELEVLQGQESFRIRSLVNSNIWAVFPSGKANFKRGDLIDCYFPNLSNSNLI